MKNQISDAYLARLEAEAEADFRARYREDDEFLNKPHTKLEHDRWVGIDPKDILYMEGEDLHDPCDCNVDEERAEELAFLSSPHTKGAHELFFNYAIQAKDVCDFLCQTEPCDCQVPEEEK